jgi:hypothetical protein
MAAETIMRMVSNLKPLYDDKVGLYRMWIREGKNWSEGKARKEARALAAHFAEAIESMPGPSRPSYKPVDFDQAADEMIEEFKTEELPKWSSVLPKAVPPDGIVVTRDGETIETGFKNTIDVIKWFHARHSYSLDHGVLHEGYDVLGYKNGRVVWSYRKEVMKRNRHR